MYVFLSIPVCAGDLYPVTACYTAENIYYTDIILSIEPLSYTTLADNVSVIITKEITYSGIVTPDATIFCKQYIDNVLYSGTLYLQEFHYSNGKTIAIYKGTLTAQ